MSSGNPIPPIYYTPNPQSHPDTACSPATEPPSGSEQTSSATASRSNLSRSTTILGGENDFKTAAAAVAKQPSQQQQEGLTPWHEQEVMLDWGDPMDVDPPGGVRVGRLSNELEGWEREHGKGWGEGRGEPMDVDGRKPPQGQAWVAGDGGGGGPHFQQRMGYGGWQGQQQQQQQPVMGVHQAPCSTGWYGQEQQQIWPQCHNSAYQHQQQHLHPQVLRQQRAQFTPPQHPQLHQQPFQQQQPFHHAHRLSHSRQPAAPHSHHQHTHALYPQQLQQSYAIHHPQSQQPLPLLTLLQQLADNALNIVDQAESEGNDSDSEANNGPSSGVRKIQVSSSTQT